MNPKTRNARIAAGVCIECGGELDTNGKVCSKCREKKREEQRADREFYRSHGICPYCRTERIFGSEGACPECRAKFENANERHRKKNREKCREQSNAYHRKYYHERKEKGICVRCGKYPAKEGGTYCVRCSAKKKEYERKVREKRGVIIPRSERVENGLCYICGAPIKEGRICKDCSDKATKNFLGKRGGGEHWRKQNSLIFRNGGKT